MDTVGPEYSKSNSPFSVEPLDLTLESKYRQPAPMPNRSESFQATSASSSRIEPSIEDRRWTLVELRGKPIESSKATLTLRADDSVTSGNASCNTFTGGYAIKNGQRIRFERNMAVTRMACPDMTIEAAFLETLQQVDNYAVGEDGMLSLNRARMAPLARFAPHVGP